MVADPVPAADTPTSTNTTTTTSTTIAPPRREPLGAAGPAVPAARPLLGDVVVIGDSLSAGLAAPLRAALDDGVRAVDWRWWVGFTVPNPSRVWETVLHDERPDVVVLFFAAWESEVIRDGRVLDPDDSEWRQSYREDFVAPWVELVRTGDTEIVWVGMTPSRDPAVSEHHAALSDIWRDVADSEGDISWIDGASIVGGSGGAFVEFDETIDPPARVVAIDGMHLCPSATVRIADEVLRSLAERRALETVTGWRSSGWEFHPDAFGQGGCPRRAESSASSCSMTRFDCARRLRSR